MAIHRIAVLALLLLGFGCGVDCDAVATRLLEDCKISFGIGGSQCADPDEPYALAIRYCDITDPSGDTACWMESSCDDILAGACSMSGDPGPEEPDDCSRGCFVTALNCTDACEVGPMCSDCAVRCNAERRRCYDDC